MSTSLEQIDPRPANTSTAAASSDRVPVPNEPGDVLVDRTRLPPAGEGAEVFWAWAAVDLATGWVHGEVLPGSAPEIARQFLATVKQRASFKVRTVLVESAIAGGVDRSSVAQTLEQICAEQGFEYRSTPSGSPGSASAAERFFASLNRELERIGPTSAEDCRAIVSGYVQQHNATTRLSGASHESALQALSRWYASRPDLFVSNPAEGLGPRS